jgi:dihydrofolate synthase/folylpolyglutamate synthase
MGNPQRGLPVIHITGTSGKGSTAVAIAALLQGAGLRVGLATSPYLQVATEKLQIDGSLVSGDDLLDAVMAVELAEASWSAHTGEPRLTYAEAWVAVTLHVLATAKVDVAVVEVSAGGRFDATNVVEPVACVITNIGIDHVESLGPTLRDIAWHKAGILKPGAVAVTGERRPDTLAIITDEATAVGVELRVVEAPRDSGDIGLAPHLRANRAIALAAVAGLADSGCVDPTRIDARVLEGARLPGRFESMPEPNDRAVVLDGAHNPDKVAALMDEVELWRGVNHLPPPVVVAGALAAKDARGLAPALMAGEALVATTASTTAKPGIPAAAIASEARLHGFRGPVAVAPEPGDAMATALDLADKLGTWVLGTGSLYLVGSLRRRWYSDRSIVEWQTPWPRLEGKQGDR